MGSRHWDREGNVSMVDVSGKATTVRRAVVKGTVLVKDVHLEALKGNPKGDVFATARLAGIQAAKKCWDLIPMCHPILLRSVDVRLEVVDKAIQIEAEVIAEEVTGVEMEGYCAVAITGLTLIDMLKGVDPDLTLTDIQLVKKTGGKSDFNRG